MSSMDSSPFDSAAAGIVEERLSDVLTQIHREGFGHNTQVVRPERGRVLDRLFRAGLETAGASRLANLDRPIVLIFAPARIDDAEIILRRGGAVQVERYTQSSGTQSTLIGFDPNLLQPRRSSRGSGSATGM